MARIVCCAPLGEERCLRHRVWRRTRHPKVGAAERRAALLFNVISLCELANRGRLRQSSGAPR